MDVKVGDSISHSPCQPWLQCSGAGSIGSRLQPILDRTMPFYSVCCHVPISLNLMILSLFIPNLWDVGHVPKDLSPWQATVVFCNAASHHICVTSVSMCHGIHVSFSQWAIPLLHCYLMLCILFMVISSFLFQTTWCLFIVQCRSSQWPFCHFIP